MIQRGFDSTQYGGRPKGSFFVRLTMKLSGGRITNESQANAVLIVIACVFFALAVLIYVFGGDDAGAPSGANIDPDYGYVPPEPAEKPVDPS